MASENEQGEADTTLSDEAIEWLVRLHSGSADASDHADFAAWRTQSVEHEIAAQEAEAIWHGVGAAGDEARKGARSARRRKHTRRAVLGLAALGATGAVAVRSGLIGPHLFADHVTGVGEQRTVLLADGSTVLLNAGTAFSVDYDGSERRITLYRGEAVFKVVSDPLRPFVVTARQGETRAIGTVFDVDMRESDVAVTVLEGAVEVSTQGQPVTLRADQQSLYLGAEPPSPPQPIDAEAETAWRRGKLIVNARPLGDVVAAIERYQSGPIVLASSRTRSLNVTSVFDLNDPDMMLRTIEATLPVTVTRLPFVTLIH